LDVVDFNRIRLLRIAQVEGLFLLVVFFDFDFFVAGVSKEDKANWDRKLFEDDEADDDR